MHRHILIVTLSALIGHPSAGKAVERSKARRSMEVRVQDYAGLPKGLIKLAAGTATQVFRKAGIELEWVECTPHNPNRSARCRQEASEAARIIRILPPEMTAKTPASGIEFGRALLTPDGSRGTYASVYWNRVQGLAAGAARTVSLGRDDTSRRLKQGRILGYVIAHELAHLLGVHHSKAGVMHGPWSPSELADLLRGTLRFQRSEEGKMRASLATDSSSATDPPTDSL